MTIAANEGPRAISRLADRIAAMAPPGSHVLELTNPVPPPFQPSPAVSAALNRTAIMSAQAAQHTAPRRSRSLFTSAIEGFVAACSFIPYALVGLALRLVMARVFFLDGQSKVDGLRLPISAHGYDFSFVLPMQVKAETINAFLTQYYALPVPAVPAAYVVGFAEFLLPIMLVLGFGTRIAALGLLIITAMIQIYVLPQALWSVHVYWASMLLVLVSLGPGQVSADAIFRFFSRR